MEDEDADGGGKHVVARVAAILDALAGQPGGMSLGDIAKVTGLPRSTVQRLVRALGERELVTGGRGSLRLGSAITRLAGAAHVDMARAALPFMEAAARHTLETVDLSIQRGDHTLLIRHVPSDRELRVVSPAGTAFPIHCTAPGKALLADLDDATIRALLPDRLDRRTGRTMVDVERLLDEVATVRVEGLAFDRGEHAQGVCALGLTLPPAAGERYALSIAVPELRFDEALPELRAALLKCRAEILQAVQP